MNNNSAEVLALPELTRLRNQAFCLELIRQLQSMCDVDVRLSRHATLTAHKNGSRITAVEVP